MATPFELTIDSLLVSPRMWLVTGAAGFIGSNLVEELLRCGQRVVGLDNFVTGHRGNLEDVSQRVGSGAWQRFTFIEGDVVDLPTCNEAMTGVDYVLHQAALGSVPRSIADPLASHRANVDGFLNVLTAARDAKVRRLVYASSSSVYGDSPVLPKRESQIGAPLSPYALTKSINEQYASLYTRVYGTASIGLRYFNVFGRRQDPNGPYAAVIPRWIENLIHGAPCTINGDGETSRDFCYVANAVQANILAATAENEDAVGRVYNIAVSERTTLNKLYRLLRDELARCVAPNKPVAADDPIYAPFRAGDVRHSLADISLAQQYLGYRSSHSLAAGLAETIEWYVQKYVVSG